LEGNFREELKRDREERRMPYITGFERDGMVLATRESVIDVLETRFEAVPSELSNSLEEIKDITVLKRLHKQSITIGSVQEFERLLKEMASQNPSD
jgi:hypothetical protein